MKVLLLFSLFSYAAGFVLNVFHVIYANKNAGRISTFLIAVGVALHTAALLTRSYSSGHLPIASAAETLLFYSWAAASLTVVVILRYGERLLCLITVPLSAAALLSSFLTISAPRSLPLILKTYWFEAHVMTSFAGYALFTLAFAGAAFYLLGDIKGGFTEAAMRDFQDIATSAVEWGFFFFSASMFAGAIWAYLAWGNYWLWEPKMLWSFIVWFWYAGTMHVYYVREWKGRGQAIATVLGFFVVLFTYVGVGFLMKSSHNF